MDEQRRQESERTMRELYGGALLVRRAAVLLNASFLHAKIGHAVFTYDEGEVYISATEFGQKVWARELAAGLGLDYPDDDDAVDANAGQA